MSGGVDSSVVAKLLAEQDYDLSAVFMRNWDTRDESGTDKGCEWEKDWEDVQRVCKMLDIPCEMVDLSQQYWTRVFEPSLQLWEKGQTPNPDIWCNREVKFGALMDQLTGDDVWVATGHYADKSWFPCKSLRRPRDRTKDQTYYLSAIPEASLARTIFPLAPFAKTEVRAMAKKWELPTAQRAESMGICFVGEKRRFDGFLSQYITPRQGPIIDLQTGKQLGTHTGLWTYTIGQNARLPGMPERMFVAKKDAERNEIYVVPSSTHPALYSRSLIASAWQWIWRDHPPGGIDDELGFHGRVQYRHRMLDAPATIQRRGHTIHITFEEPQQSVAPGQIAAVWDGDWCLGSGIITGTSGP
ncbi:predicted protein [Postia placenta Mad-698-R]|uniref:tRNA-5-taurinomethyluridine 2-sulfurtransferase n=1 Tax=Postia placenta MAD-698-R-SB12 TaxID=670580 RepID=A0A1X6NA33_9APHY|nr:hypothetical protein POSPLADRAFT_1044860 [Postia placenta MAD-698-R-SB12]EED82467.1 predicted protein [Postia placenta Mad-698-R]OSX65509.1 hypothetical protein POSPLADRAFT_1044860 [Postia placenta MAD-698-R-SB12]